MDDMELLRDYATRHSEEAFTTLVTRHIDLVYSVALRHTRNHHQAQEITQAVFVVLARKAPLLNPRTVLAGWLFETARLTAANYVRGEIRRARREQEASMQFDSNDCDEDAWQHVMPILNEIIGGLCDKDRDAVVLRFLQGKDYRQVAAALGATEEAAQMRVTRALEKMRKMFARRGVVLSASALGVAIAAQGTQAAPAGLAAMISAAVSSGTAISTSTVLTTTKIIAMTTLQKTVVAATVVALAGAGIFEAHQNFKLHEQTQTLQRQQALLTEQIRQLQSECDNATNRLANLLAENNRLNSNSDRAELLKLRSEVGILRNQSAKGSSSNSKIEQGPLSSASAYYERARKFSQNHQYEDELDDLNKAIDLDPNFAEVYMERANLYALNLPKEKGGYMAAVADYSRVLELEPMDDQARHLRAMDYEQLGQYDNAIADYTTTLNNGNTDFSDKELAGEHLNRGRLYQWQKRDYEKAIADYTAALQLDPQINGAHRHRGVCYELLGESKKAQDDFLIEPKSN